jgi:NADH:ubiquinone oxidoreductase subunit 5 (subunit L)/multisubunit Na+/H+ antiporter MnhA subunit
VEIASFLSGNVLPHTGVLLAGIALLIVGLGFKVAAVPFHFWTPDVYQGAPTPFTGYMAAVAKAAGFAGLLRVLNGAFSTQQANWRPAIWLITILTLAVGSVLALAQKDLKRMFAYSSISQAGYVLVGVQAASTQGTAGALYYLFTYTFIIVGTFAIVALIQGAGEARNDLGAVRGLSRRQPLLALAMLIFLLAQAGVPFTTGFLGKFYVISAAIQRGQYALGVIAMLAAAVAAFFYLWVALLMYSTEPAGETAPAGDAAVARPVPAGVGEAGPEAAAAGAPVPVTAGAPPYVGEATGGSPGAVSRGVPGATPAGAPGQVPAGPNGGTPPGFLVPDTDGALTAGLQPVPGLDGPPAGQPGADVPAGSGVAAGSPGAPAEAVTLAAPPEGRIPVPTLVAVTLAVCAAFTVVAGVSAFMITFARQATMLF